MKDSVSMPLVQYCIALINISTFITPESVIRVAFLEVICLLDANTEDESDVTRFALASLTERSKLLRLEDFFKIETTLSE